MRGEGIRAAGLRVLAAASILACSAVLLRAEEPLRRPRIGLALGGGGARGFSHIGALEALEELHIPVDYIAGTSMGSIVGGLYAMGYSPRQMAEIIEKIHWGTIFEDTPERPQLSFRRKENDFAHLLPLSFGFQNGKLALPTGLIAGSKLGFVLQGVTLPSGAVTDFDHLRIPFRAVACDVQTGAVVVLSKGSLARAIRASMAIPAIFTPVQMDGRLLIDGGEAQNLPVETVRAMGADIVIAFDVGASGQAAEEPKNVAEMLSRIIDIPLKQNTFESRKLADLVIQPDLKGFTSGDFLKSSQMAPRGRAAVLRMAERLKAWSIPPEEHAAWKKRHEAPLPPPPVVDAVEVVPIPGFDSRRILRLVRTQPGRPLDLPTLGADLKRIYGLGHFVLVSFDLAEDDGKRILRIEAVPKSWGPTYIRPGLNLQSDFQGNAEFDVAVLLEATEMNRLGGEWKTLVDVGSNLGFLSVFHQPISHTGQLSLAPRVALGQLLTNVFIEGERQAQYLVRRFEGGLDVVSDFGSWGELRVGYARGSGRATRKIGDPLFPNLRADIGGLQAGFWVDQLDNVNAPKEGYFAQVVLAAQRRGLGATESYDRLDGTVVGVRTLGRFTGLVRLSGGDGLGTRLPFYDQFTLGGLFNLSGLPRNLLLGETYGFAAAILLYRLNDTPGFFVRGLYVGASVEAGNVWRTRSEASLSNLKNAGSVFLSADTLIGPAFLAYGRASGGSHAYYFYLSRLF